MNKGKVAVVTGAGSGIGKQVAKQLAEQGVKVVVVNRTESKGLATLKEIKDNGGEGIFVQADVQKEEDVKNYVKEAEEAYGKIDMFFNNAGYSGLSGLTHLMELTDFKNVIDTNITGVFLGLKYVIGSMLKNGVNGTIVNTSSQSGVKVIPYLTAYSATKHAVISMTKTTAYEYAKQGIRVNAICPGYTMTDMTARLENTDDPIKQKMLEGVMEGIPMGRGASSEEMAKHVLYLLGDESSYITGHAMVVDGGAVI